MIGQNTQKLLLGLALSFLFYACDKTPTSRYYASGKGEKHDLHRKVKKAPSVEKSDMTGPAGVGAAEDRAYSPMPKSFSSDSYMESESRGYAEEVISKDAYEREMDASWADGTVDKAYDETGGESALTSGNAGVLTAGEINDFSKWDLWEDLTKDEFNSYSKKWQLTPVNRMAVQVKTTSGQRVVDALVRLKNKEGNVVWTARTDNTGKAELWTGLYEEQDQASYELEVTTSSRGQKVINPSTFQNGINVIEMPDNCEIPDQVDIAFMVDATGSMGDEISYLKAELTDIMGKVKANHPKLTLNLGSVFYRDHHDDYLTRISKLSNDITRTTNFIAEQSANGGGDYPEAVDEGLEKAVNELGWSKDARARILFVILDAPPHQTQNEIMKIQNAIASAAEKGIRIVPITASGIDKSTEFLMRSMALATNGTYVFLTDHSGVGNAHIEPSTDSYDIELLNDLMIRLIDQYVEVPTCEELAELESIRMENDTMLVSSTLAKAGLDSATLEAGVDTVGVPVIDEPSSLKYYPNPTYGNVTLEIEGAIEEVFLADMNGKLIKRITLNGDGHVLEKINIAEFPSGTYVLQYLANDKWQSGKLLLLH